VLLLFLLSSAVASAWPLLGEQERLLVLGIPTAEEARWKEALTQAGVEFRYHTSQRAFYIQQDPIPVLQTVGDNHRSLLSTASRGWYERTLEKELSHRWPEIQDARACVAFPSGVVEEKDSEPIAMIMVQGLNASEAAAARDLVASKVKGLPADNVMLVGLVREEPRSEKGNGERLLLTKSN
jgi:hypothetical protein